MRAQEIIDLCYEELGYQGKKNADINYLYDKNANTLGLYTKYAYELAHAKDTPYYNFDKSGYDWCCVFTDWLFYHLAGTKEEAIKIKPYNIYNAGIKWSKKSFVDAGRIGKEPKPGACIFFTDSTGELAHTGIVVAVNGDTITTIEGNVSKRVMERTYNKSYVRIDSYGYPFYDESPEPEPDWTTVAEWSGLNKETYRLQVKA